MSTDKLCVDCAHFHSDAFWLGRPDLIDAIASCLASDKPSPVTGAVQFTCRVMRTSGSCGPDARLFKPRERT